MSGLTSRLAQASADTELLLQKLAVLAPMPVFYLEGLKRQAEQGELRDGDLVWIACDVLIGRAA